MPLLRKVINLAILLSFKKKNNNNKKLKNLSPLTVSFFLAWVEFNRQKTHHCRHLLQSSTKIMRAFIFSRHLNVIRFSFERPL